MPLITTVTQVPDNQSEVTNWTVKEHDLPARPCWLAVEERRQLALVEQAAGLDALAGKLRQDLNRWVGE